MLSDVVEVGFFDPALKLRIDRDDIFFVMREHADRSNFDWHSSLLGNGGTDAEVLHEVRIHAHTARDGRFVFVDRHEVHAHG